MMRRILKIYGKAVGYNAKESLGLLSLTIGNNQQELLQLHALPMQAHGLVNSNEKRVGASKADPAF